MSTEILRITRGDPTLQAQLRGIWLDIYYEGYLMFRVGNRGRLQVGSTHDRWPDRPCSLDELTEPDVAEWIARVKNARCKQYRAGSENSFESKFLRDNERPPAMVIPLDRQIVHPGEDLLRVDALLYDLCETRLVLAELKVHDNPEIRTSVFHQLAAYRSLFERHPSLREEYSSIFAQKRRLGLIEHEVDAIETAEAPLLLLLIAGHPDSEYGVRMSSRAIENSLRVKSARWNDLPVHIKYWNDFQKENLTLSESAAELPTFEEWATAMLS